MIVKQIWTANYYRNFNYLIACAETGEALAVDPLDHEKCLQAAKDEGFTITQILNTHEHRDHTGGNDAMVERTGAAILAHRNAKDSIPGMTRGLERGRRRSRWARPSSSKCSTRRATRCATCACARTPTRLRSFAAIRSSTPGAGNCHNGGHPSELYKTFSEQLARLPASTLIYPGPRLHREQPALHARPRAGQPERARHARPHRRATIPRNAIVTTLEIERGINTFFRLTSPTVIARLREAFPDLPDQPDARTVFLKLRELRNKW